MGSELKGQSVQLDALTAATEDNSDHMAKNTARARKLAGGKPTDPTQFMEDKAGSAAKDAKQSARKAALAGMRNKYG